jgi:putative toxin-antitoxin system antitoxin component (TIGR02293 family)
MRYNSDVTPAEERAVEILGMRRSRKGVARLYTMAEDVLGSRAEAQRWMKTPNRALDGARPLDDLESEIAAREVEDLLGRIRYGIFG